ncbi:hypothetical protein FQN54_009960 [Arachnomyces sp. PD_36]|nr:hypothetical protein FQN54_009960 [Arachnomyces sp. PD_36]
MKFSIAFYALLSVAPLISQGFALPQPEIGNNAVAAVTAVPVDAAVVPRQSDEWTLVLYNEGENGGQCGGTSEEHTGGSGVCLGWQTATKLCADLKVTANLGIASCSFSFKYDGDNCSGDNSKTETVEAGKDSNGVPLTDDVKFVSIECKE